MGGYDLVKYSIIVPVYNVKKYLNECIRSILDQKYFDLEILLIDDDSTDGSRQLCEWFQNEYDFIKLFKNKSNRGLSYTRNVGLSHATGCYIWFIDSDDYIEGFSFIKLDNILTKMNDPDILYFDFKEIYSDHTKTVTMPKEISRHMFYGGNVCRCIYKTSFINRINLKFPLNLYGEDLFFNTVAANKAKKIEYIRIPLYMYRKTVDGSIMDKRSMKLINDVLIVSQQLIKYFKTESVLSELDLFVLNSCVGRLFDFLLFCIIDFPNNALNYQEEILKTLDSTNVNWIRSNYFHERKSIFLKYIRCLMKHKLGVRLLKLNYIRKAIKKRLDKKRSK